MSRRRVRSAEYRFRRLARKVARELILGGRPTSAEEIALAELDRKQYGRSWVDDVLDQTERDLAGAGLPDLDRLERQIESDTLVRIAPLAPR